MRISTVSMSIERLFSPFANKSRRRCFWGVVGGQQRRGWVRSAASSFQRAAVLSDGPPRWRRRGKKGFCVAAAVEEDIPERLERWFLMALSKLHVSQKLFREILH